MTERERILQEIKDALESADATAAAAGEVATTDELAEVALRVIEAPVDSQAASYDRVCTCSQSGYPENSPYSNHDHAFSCPQFSG